MLVLVLVLVLNRFRICLTGRSELGAGTRQAQLLLPVPFAEAVAVISTGEETGIYTQQVRIPRAAIRQSPI